VEPGEDKVGVGAAAAQDAVRDKGQVGWVARQPDRAASASAQRVGIASRMSLRCPAPKDRARNVALGWCGNDIPMMRE